MMNGPKVKDRPLIDWPLHAAAGLRSAVWSNTRMFGIYREKKKSAEV